MRRSQKELNAARLMLTEFRLRQPEIFMGILACAQGIHLFKPLEDGEVHKTCQRCGMTYVRDELLNAIVFVGVDEA